MTHSRLVSCAAALLLAAGCASFDGRSLVPGQSSVKDVETQLGKPADRLRVAGGDTIWYYPRAPMGRQTWAVRIAPDGTVRSVEQVLTEQNIRRIVPGKTTRDEARVIVGPPWRSSRIERMQREVWEYTMYNDTQWPWFLYLQFSDDGIVREVVMMKDYVNEQGGTKD